MLSNFRVVMSATNFAQNDVRFVFTTICYVGGSRFIYAFLYSLTYTGVQHDFGVI